MVVGRVASGAEKLDGVSARGRPGTRRELQSTERERETSDGVREAVSSERRSCTVVSCDPDGRGTLANSIVTQFLVTIYGIHDTEPECGGR